MNAALNRKNPYQEGFFAALFVSPHPAGDDEKVEGDQYPEAADEETTAMSLESRIHGDFLGSQSEIFENKYGLVEPHMEIERCQGSHLLFIK